jgi:hypothetical protein
MINTKYDILGQLYIFSITSCKRFHSKILLKKMKRTKKGLWSFYKVIPLVPLSVFAPKNKCTCCTWSLKSTYNMGNGRNQKYVMHIFKCKVHTTYMSWKINFLFILSTIISLLVYGNNKIMLPLPTTILHQTCCLLKT